MGKYFGTDGFRGEANVDLTVEHAFEVGRFIGWYFGKEHKCKVVIGKDTRRSSYMFEYALVAGLTASGADAYLLHVTTTPSVSYVVRTEDFDCGIMISASHNPFYDNGIKLINDKGEKMQEYVIDEIEKYLDEEKKAVLEQCAPDGTLQDHFEGRQLNPGHAIESSWFILREAIERDNDKNLIELGLKIFDWMWECVGGSVVKGEDSLSGAIREAKEEVGVDLMPENGQVLFTKTRKIIEGKIFNDIMDVWLFEYEGEVDLGNATTDEVAQVAWMNREQIKELFDANMFVDTLEYFFTEDDRQ